MCVMTRAERPIELVVLVVGWRGRCWRADGGDAMELGTGDGGRCGIHRASQIQGTLTLAGCSLSWHPLVGWSWTSPPTPCVLFRPLTCR